MENQSTDAPFLVRRGNGRGTLESHGGYSGETRFGRSSTPTLVQPADRTEGAERVMKPSRPGKSGGRKDPHFSCAFKRSRTGALATSLAKPDTSLSGFETEKGSAAELCKCRLRT